MPAQGSLWHEEGILWEPRQAVGGVPGRPGREAAALSQPFWPNSASPPGRLLRQGRRPEEALQTTSNGPKP